MIQSIALVQGQLEAYNNFDIDKFCSFYHPEIIVTELLENKILSDGIVKFRTNYEQLFSKYPNQKCILKSRIVAGDAIVDEELILHRPAYPDGLHAVAIYSFRDNLIDRVWFLYSKT